MRVNTGRTGGGRAFTLPVLMVAVFTVSVGHGVVLPRLPRLIERLQSLHYRVAARSIVILSRERSS